MFGAGFWVCRLGLVDLQTRAGNADDAGDAAGLC